MRVRNIVVENRDKFEELLIKELIENQIGYVKINHEFHFLNNIIRLYDFKKDRKKITKNSLIKLEDDISQKFKKYIEVIDKDKEILIFNDIKKEKINKKLLKKKNNIINNYFKNKRR